MFELPAGRPCIMGILNVTPDSFSDGGQFSALDKALSHAERMMSDGADLIDVGGESTRPGHEGVSAEDELARILPVVRGLQQRGIPFSIDTQKAVVAEAALENGCAVVNDVSSLSDPAMGPLVASSGATVCLMQWGPASTCGADLAAAADRAQNAGIGRDRFWVDPGVGFGKSTAENLSVLRNLSGLVGLGYPVLVGVSRKSFIGKTLGTEESPIPVDQRGAGTLAVELDAVRRGAAIIRTHDVRSLAQALAMVRALA